MFDNLNVFPEFNMFFEEYNFPDTGEYCNNKCYSFTIPQEDIHEVSLFV